MIAAIVPVWQTQLEHGWLELAFGGWAWLVWVAVAVWVACTVLAIRRHNAWWLLATAPFALYPVAVAGVILAACATGNCL
ncbi:hypothetical protein [Sphingomonas sp. Y38-1Y]|uniref:hypothetical protein n=1 Tax=Sphingomonas sp. Y38-1Y TaxID=3078265 RepID=UPI0028EA5F08|nr:hypothetical protein [Sphingomonas sp. Y38-1Y]